MTQNDKTLFNNLSATTKFIIRNAVTSELLRSRDDLATVISVHGSNTIVVRSMSTQIASMQLFLDQLYGKNA